MYSEAQKQANERWRKKNLDRVAKYALTYRHKNSDGASSLRREIKDLLMEKSVDNLNLIKEFIYNM